jgi:hypothetical protein
MARAELA